MKIPICEVVVVRNELKDHHELIKKKIRYELEPDIFHKHIMNYYIRYIPLYYITGNRGERIVAYAHDFDGADFLLFTNKGNVLIIEAKTAKNKTNFERGLTQLRKYQAHLEKLVRKDEDLLWNKLKKHKEFKIIKRSEMSRNRRQYISNIRKKRIYRILLSDYINDDELKEIFIKEYEDLNEKSRRYLLLIELEGYVRGSPNYRYIHNDHLSPGNMVGYLYRIYGGKKCSEIPDEIIFEKASK